MGHRLMPRPPTTPLSRATVAARKDRNVDRSSHGKFPDVAALVAHQAKKGR